jgi:uncharacterized protein YrrD
MIIKYSQIIHSPVVEIKNQSRLGIVEEIILRKSNLNILAAVVRIYPILPIRKVITSDDIVEIAKEAVIVQSEDSISDIKENVRIAEALKGNAKGVGQKVVTKSGKYLGRVFDYTVESTACALVSIYVKYLISVRIISRAAIVDFDKDKIVVEDDFETIKASVLAETQTA